MTTFRRGGRECFGTLCAHRVRLALRNPSMRRSGLADTGSVTYDGTAPVFRWIRSARFGTLEHSKTLGNLQIPVFNTFSIGHPHTSLISAFVGQSSVSCATSGKTTERDHIYIAEVCVTSM
jgi:hypothetical protein